MHILSPLIIVAMMHAAPTPESRYPDTVELYHCDFEPDVDADFDQSPDGWSRQRGAGFPHYLEIKLVADQAPSGQQALRIDLNGGAACAHAPLVPVDSDHDYVLEGYLRTDGLKNDEAFYRVTFLDADQRELAEFSSPRRRVTDGWEKLRIGPITKVSAKARYARISLCLLPTTRPDLHGSALFDDVWFGRMPRMTLSAEPNTRLVEVGQEVRITCHVSGFNLSQPRLHWKLEDASRQTLAESEQAFTLADDPRGAQARSASEKPTGKSASNRWTPPLDAPGFYRIRATLEGDSGQVHEREITLAMVQGSTVVLHGEFGWSLSGDTGPLPLSELASVLPQLGVHWVKLPVWFSDREPSQVDELLWFVERMNAQDLEVVGVLSDPPAEVREKLALGNQIVAADIFAQDPAIWYPSVEPVMARLALKVRWWQLGDDRDSSFVGYPDLVAKIEGVKRSLDQIGQSVHVGINWGWLDEPPSTGDAPWDFMSRNADPPLTSAELSEYLRQEHGAAAQWVMLDPLDPSQYSMEKLASDLVHRMVAAKADGSTAIFFPNPTRGTLRLLNDEGNPTELLLPWRSTAMHLAGRAYLGSLQLPGGSENRLFVGPDDVLMVVWNETPGQETISLGPATSQEDVWGRTVPRAEDSSSGHVLQVGPLPSFVRGISEPLARMQLGFSLGHSQLPSEFGIPHADTFHMRNFFKRGVSGKVRLVAPDDWKVVPETIDFSLGADEELEQPFEVTVPFHASCGERPMRFEVELGAERHHQFSVQRQISVGLGDLEMEIATRMNDRGELEVEQRFINRSPARVSFRCYLSAPTRRRMRTQVLKLPPGEDVQTYRIRNGDELLGQSLWLRAEELGGKRALSYRFIAEP